MSIKSKLMLAWCWALYYAGDTTHKVQQTFDWGGPSSLYSWLMNESIAVNDHYGFDVWQE